jgi:hypothetical protein
MRPKLVWALVALASIGAGMLLFSPRPDATCASPGAGELSPRPAAGDEEPDPAELEAALGTNRSSVPVFDAPEEPIPHDPLSRRSALERAKKTLELYKEATVYPYWSRRADGSTMHLINWQKTYPIGQPWAADTDGREIRADLTLDKLFAGPGEALTAMLTVTRTDDGTPFTPDDISARVEYFDASIDAWSKAEDVPWMRKDNAWVAKIRPSSIAALSAAPREAAFVASVRLGEDFFKELRMPFRYAASPALIFHGLVGDRIAGGSLEVVLDLEILHQAPTLIQAGLFDEAGKKPIAVYDDYFRPIHLGRQQVVIRFFGRAIRESGISGPYRIRALHGHVHLTHPVPLELFYSVPEEPPLVTRAHPLSSFSDAEWSSPDRDAKIAHYEDVIRELEAP